MAMKQGEMITGPIGAMLTLSLVIVVTVLAALYNENYNCDLTLKSEPIRATTTTAKPSVGRPMKIFPGIKRFGYTKLEDTPAKAHVKTLVYSNVDGKSMQGGVLKIDKGTPLEYTHWYEGLVFVIDGQLKLTNGFNGIFARAKVPLLTGQSFHVPRGMKVSYDSISSTSYLFFTMLTPTLDQSSSATRFQAALKRNNHKLTVKAKAKEISPTLPIFNNSQNSLSYLKDLLVAGKDESVQLIGGLYKLLNGPALDYTYTYEEFKYIVDGEFVLRDGTGQTIAAMEGDLMYFPRGCSVNFTSPVSALGFFVGQIQEGEA